MKNRSVSLLFLGSVIALHLFLLFKTTFTAWPEMFSFPYLFNNGYRFYSDFVHPYPPVLTMVLASVFSVFGYSVLALRLVTYFLIVVADVLVFLIVLKTSKDHVTAFLSLIFYLFAQTFLEGNMLWFDTALVVPLLFAYWAHVYGRKGVWSSLLIASLIKQTALLYTLAYGALSLIQKRKSEIRKIVFVFFVGWGGLFLYLLLTNSLHDFILWNFYYPFTQWPGFPGYVSFALTKRDLLLVMLVSVPVVIAFLKRKFFPVVLYVVALISIYPRFSFFHMQVALCFAAICMGSSPLKRIEKVLVSVFVALFIIYLLKGSVSYGDIRFYSGSDIKLSSQIQTEIPPGSSVYLLNVPSQHYVLTHTLPPKPWLDNYGWYYEMPGQMQLSYESFIAERPDYIVRQQPLPGNWYDLGTYEPAFFTNLLSSSYEEIKTIDSGITIWKRKI